MREEFWSGNGVSRLGIIALILLSGTQISADTIVREFVDGYSSGAHLAALLCLDPHIWENTD